MRPYLVLTLLSLLTIPPVSATGEHHVCSPGAPAQTCVQYISWESGTGDCGALEGETYSRGDLVNVVVLTQAGDVGVFVTDGCSQWDYSPYPYSGHIQTLAVALVYEDNEGSYQIVELAWQRFDAEYEGGSVEGCDMRLDHSGDPALFEGPIASLGGCPAGDPPVGPALP